MVEIEEQPESFLSSTTTCVIVTSVWSEDCAKVVGCTIFKELVYKCGYLEHAAIFNWKPVELLQNRRGPSETMLICNNACQSVLDTL